MSAIKSVSTFKFLKFKFSLKNTTNVLCFVWFRCCGCVSLALLWYYFGILGCSAGIPSNVQLLCHCSGVFHCSTGVPCSGVPGFIVCHSFMLSLEKSASIVFSVHSLSDFTWLRKKLYLPLWTTLTPFNNQTKLTKILTKKIIATGFGLFQYKYGHYI